MTEASITLKAARTAKEGLTRRLADRTDIVGIGVTRRGKGYAVKVNLANADAAASLPQAVNGVPVISEVVGTIRRR